MLLYFESIIHYRLSYLEHYVLFAYANILVFNAPSLMMRAAGSPAIDAEEGGAGAGHGSVDGSAFV